MGNNVIHPNHYNIPGRKECIEEMIEKFGHEKTEAFCELNSYKYQYRHELKNGQEDLDKASNYQNMLQKMIENDPRFKIAEHYGFEGQCNQLIEEMAELTQALCKWNRKFGCGQTLPKEMTVDMLGDNIIEEMADVKLVLEQLIYLMGADEEVQLITNKKIKRTLERIGENNASN